MVFVFDNFYNWCCLFRDCVYNLMCFMKEFSCLYFIGIVFYENFKDIGFKSFLILRINCCI